MGITQKTTNEYMRGADCSKYSNSICRCDILSLLRHCTPDQGGISVGEQMMNQHFLEHWRFDFFVFCLLTICVGLFACRSVDDANVGVVWVDVTPARLTPDANSAISFTFHTRGDTPVVIRNLGCDGDPMVLERQHEIQFRPKNSGNASEWVAIPQNNVGPALYDENLFRASIPGKLKQAWMNNGILAEGICYSIRVKFPADDHWPPPEPEYKTFSFGPVDACVGVDTGTDTGTMDTGSSTTQDTSPDSDTESNTGIDTTVDTQTDSDTDSVLHWEAECALSDPNVPAYCDGQKGAASGGPTCNADCSAVTNMVPGSYLQMNSVDISPYRSIRVFIRSLDGESTIQVRLDEAGPVVATITVAEDVSNSGFQNIAAPLDFVRMPSSVVRNPHVIKFQSMETDGNEGTIQLDWMEFSPNVLPGEWDPETCENAGDCLNACWQCAEDGFCSQEKAVCDNNPDCAALESCVKSTCTSPLDGEWNACYNGCLNGGDFNPNSAQDDFQDLEDCIMCDVCTQGCFEGGYLCNDLRR